MMLLLPREETRVKPDEDRNGVYDLHGRFDLILSDNKGYFVIDLIYMHLARVSSSHHHKAIVSKVSSLISE